MACLVCVLTGDGHTSAMFCLCLCKTFSLFFFFLCCNLFFLNQSSYGSLDITIYIDNKLRDVKCDCTAKNKPNQTRTRQGRRRSLL